MKRNIAPLFLCAFLLSAYSFNVLAATHMASDRISDIRNTKHNFASEDVVQLPNSELRDITSTENQVCVFCHTPHGVPNGAAKPFLWNRSNITGGITTEYTSTTLNLSGTMTLGSKSKMCLSCHDGTVAIGQVDMNGSKTDANGVTVPTPITMTSVSGNVDASGIMTGGNAMLGTDFSNDHPVGFSYDTALVGLDNELVDPALVGYIGVRASRKVTNFNQTVVDAGGTTGSDNPTGASTRISVPLESAVIAPTTGQTAFVSVASSGQVECTTCHDPHIRSTNVDENIKFLRLRRFQQTDPDGSNFDIDKDINCLACHKKTGWEDSVHGSKDDAPHTFLSAEATKRDISSGKQVWETSCLACHDTHTVDNAGWLLRQASDFSNEASDVDKSCLQCHSSSGVIDTNNGSVTDIESIMVSGGHASSTSVTTFIFADDAHKPSKVSLLDTSHNTLRKLEPVTAIKVRHAGCSDCHNPHQMQKGLHASDGSANNNDVSGALTGVQGLDVLDSGSFDPFAAESTATPVVATKEYQICFKCHSSSGHDSANIGSAPAQFSNTVKEFFGGVVSAHPVITGTGNVGLDNNLLNAPFNGANIAGVSGVGEQTMYCADCHTNTDVAGSPVSPQGSHNSDVAACEACHVSDQYLTASVTPITSGFSCASSADCVAPDTAGNSNNLHVFHATQTVGGSHACSNCHVKTPHGWRNKSLLADTSDVADFSDDTTGVEARYYPAAKMDINDVVPASGQWTRSDCTDSTCHL